MAYSGSQSTRLGLSGTPRGLTGNFFGKTEAEVVDVVAQKGGSSLTEKEFYELQRKQMKVIEAQRRVQAIVADDEEVLSILF